MSRVPLTIDAAHQLVESLSNNEFDDCQISGYRISEQASSYGGVVQRWLVVESAARRESDLQQLEKQLSKQEKTQLAALKKLSNQEFNCQVDALNAAQNSSGRFIIAINLTDTQSWTLTDILQEYKQQAVSERGFKFLKDPIFLLPVFLLSSPNGLLL